MTARAAGFVVVVAAAAAGHAGGPRADEDRLHAGHWIARCPSAERILLDADGVAGANRRMLAEAPSITDIAALPDRLDRRWVEDRIRRLGRLPDKPLSLATGAAASDADRRRWIDSLELDTVADGVEPRFGLVVRRAAIRRFPTAERVLADAADGDIDEFQETAFFPGTPVATVHASADGGWSFVVGETYAGWIAADAVALGPRAEVLGYAARSSRVVVAARATTVFTPEFPAVSQLALDMGTRLPERRDWPVSRPVNGQSAAAAIVVEVPVRTAGGALRVAAALVPRSGGTRDGPLPASRANVVRQAFRFLGERYGWGHDFDGRDCSGFVCDVYRSVGILLPRNTRDQATCPVLPATAVAADWTRERRLAAVAALLPGDLVFTRRHVMMMIGDDGGPWVIHDTHEGRVAGASANGVVVQPFAEIDGGRAADALTAVVRVLPAPPAEPP